MAAKASLLLITAFLSCSYSLAAFNRPLKAYHPVAHRPHRSLGHPRSLLAPTAAPAGTGAVASDGLAVFDVTAFGAKADGKFDNAMPFIQAWNAACKNSQPSKVLVSAGSWVCGPVVFAGPCLKPVTFEVHGTIIATVDPSEYTSPEWFLFEHIDGLNIIGTGTFDGQGQVFWPYNDCKGKSTECVSLPSSLKFNSMSNVVIDGITSLNAKQFHVHLHSSSNFTLTHLTITAPGNSPNTDGIHIGTTKGVTVAHCVIGTGDDCISIGEGAVNVNITDVTCGPGHGISVGSLGKRVDDESVYGISVKNCTFKGSTNGARIKTMLGPSKGEAKGIVYEDLVMINVSNPVIIDQAYGNKRMKGQSTSNWLVSDVHFRNIQGTTMTNSAISFDCSTVLPCAGVEVSNVNLSLMPAAHNQTFFSYCTNIKPTFSGSINPTAC